MSASSGPSSFRAAPTFKRPLEPGVAGGLAGAFSKSIVAPLELTKVQMQVSGSPALEVAKGIAERDGAAGFYRGNLATLSRIIPQRAIEFSLYGALIDLAAPEWAGHSGTRAAAGAVAGAAALTAIYPIDLIRTRLLCGAEGGMRGAFRAVLAEGGPPALYQGLGLSLAGFVPFTAINFAAKGAIKDQLDATEVGRSHTTASSALSGGAAGIIAQTATYPLDVVRRRAQNARLDAAAENHRLPEGVPLTVGSLGKMLRHVATTEGLRGLYRGALLNVGKEAIAQALVWAAYDTLTASPEEPAPGAGTDGSGALAAPHNPEKQ